MRRLIVFLIFLVASVWFGLEILRHPGYLFLVYQPWMVQMPLWFALIGLIFIFGLFYLLIDSVEQIQFLFFRLKNWLRFRRAHRSYSKTQQGLALLIEGRWSKAERMLLAGVSQSVEPLMNYLGAAKAAQEQGAFERRDNYLRKAHQVAPGADLAIGLTQAELQFEQHQLEQAAATLSHLRQISPRHPRVLALSEKVFVRLGDWQGLQAVLPNMRKARLLNAEQLGQFEKNLYCELLRTANEKPLDDLHRLYNEIPRAMRKNPEVVLAYIRQLQRFSETDEIAELIRKILKSYWQPELAQIYGTLTFTDLNRQLVIAGAWLKMHGPKPEILLLLGKLCMKAQLWGKAKDYFEKALHQGPCPQASLEYGKLLEHLGDPEEAMEKYRTGLEAAHRL